MTKGDTSSDSIELSANTDEEPNEGCRFGCEHSIQGCLRPAEWCFGFRSGRRQRRQWRFKNVTCEDFCKSFDTILNNVSDEDLKRLSARPINSRAVAASRKTSAADDKGNSMCYFTVDIITALGWLDVLDICVHSIKGTGVEEASLVVTLSLVSTGFLPLEIPGSSLCNIFLCWVPFLSVEQSQRLEYFREKVSSKHPMDRDEVLCNF